MFAPALAAISAAEMVLLREDNVPFLGMVKIAFSQGFRVFFVAHYRRVKTTSILTTNRRFCSTVNLCLHLCLLEPALQSFDQFIEDNHFGGGRAHLTLRRLDLIHPWINGNKWFKLKYNLLQAQQHESRTLLTLGGAWSNHLHAVAAAGWLHGIKTIGVVRGERPNHWSHTLEFAASCGMHLHFIDREAYGLRGMEEFRPWLHDQFGSFHFVPEGGSNFLGVNGAMEILGPGDQQQWDVIACPAGTGATAAALALQLGKHQRLMVFPVLRNGGGLRENMERYLWEFLSDPDEIASVMGQVIIEESYHFGGFGKWNESLIQFILNYQVGHAVPLDQVYTGKMMAGLYDLAAQNRFAPGTRILAIHSGGLQGRHSEPRLILT